MKLKRKRGYDGTIRTVCTDDNEKALGLIGPLSDLLEAGIVQRAPSETELNMWVLFNLNGQVLAEKPTREECFELVGWK